MGHFPPSVRNHIHTVFTTDCYGLRENSDTLQLPRVGLEYFNPEKAL